jgi:hypothetical protein
MSNYGISRRRFGELVVFGGCLQIVFRNTGSAVVECHVAGVRFYTKCSPLQVGDQVLVKVGKWKQELCYEVWNMMGEQVGYLPRIMPERVQDIPGREWRVCEVNLATVPWKRYRLRTLL